MNDNLVENTKAFRVKIMTWNIESLKNNIFLLKDIMEDEGIQLAFLSEPTVFQADFHGSLER